jgi:hypothetical protein
MNLAPIALFAYNRPDHTSIAINALIESALSQDSEIFVFIDGPKSEIDLTKTTAVRRLITEKKKHFKRFECIVRATNLGLYRNITEGISSVLEKRETVIVIEDDIVVSRNFLRYMNNALWAYQTNPRVWHINGYTESISELIGRSEGSYLTRLMWCWGWGTWREKWASYRKDPALLIDKFSKVDVHRFNMDGSLNLWTQVIDNKIGKTNSWAIFWYATIFMENGLCLSPRISHVKNIGFDGSGTNSDASVIDPNLELLTNFDSLDIPTQIEEDQAVLAILKKHFVSTHDSPFAARFKKAFRGVIRPLLRFFPRGF